ncbi:MAG: selenocysteine-specific translation elongation factor [Desulfosarcinaceae bacterium]
MKEIILGTAGHIDHGKTSLIKTITGVNTDRLKEEQERGITIELGFASLQLPSGTMVGIVDVPGHEKFVKNMVAGATGIDLVALVVAADEGIMPQTREHMEICTLLDIRHGLVVLTKTDLVDEEWLELVEEEVTSFTRGTFLEGAPIVQFSAVSGQGAEEFIKQVDLLGRDIPQRTSSGLFRLPIDRVFSMKGFGTVITGTLASGAVSVGEQVMVYPSGITSKVRGLQVHNQSVQTARAGMRTAINFQGLEKETVNRGDVVAAPGTLTPSYMIDAALNSLPGNEKAIKNRARVRFHTGTSEIMAIIVLLDREEMAPGERALVQIRLESPVNLVRGDHFVLRSYSPVRTIAGGWIINPIPEKHKRNKKEVMGHLTALTSSEPAEIVERQVQSRGFEGCSFRDLRIMTNLAEKQLEQILQSMMSHQHLVQVDKEKRTFVHQNAFEALQAKAGDHLSAFHAKNPLKQGMSREELKSKLPATMDVKLFTLLLNHMIKHNVLSQKEDIVHLVEHEVSLGDDQQSVREEILEIYREADLTPPYLKDVCQTLKTNERQARQVVDLLVKENLMVKIKGDLYYHHEPLTRLKEKIVNYLIDNGEISTPQFKDMTGASRKYVIALIEHFDSIQLTIRVGDLRQLRKKPTA